MFTKMMNHLSHVYAGEIIYVPEKLRVFIEPWLHSQGAKKSPWVNQGGEGFQRRSSPDPRDGYRWNRKTVLFFCEDELVLAYKDMPVPHIPEKITEEAYCIEFDMESREAAKVSSSKPWQKNTAKKLDDDEEKPKKKGGISW